MYAHHGVKDFVICLGYKGYIIKEYFANYALHNADLTVDLGRGDVKFLQRQSEDWTVTLVDTGLDTMTGGRLRRIREFVEGEAFFMTYGDGVADVDMIALNAFHQSHGKLATVTAVSPPGRFGALSMDGVYVTAFEEKPLDSGALINGGFFVLQPQALDGIADDLAVWEHEPLINLASTGELIAYHHGGFWQCMDTLRDRRHLESLWVTNEAPWRKWS